MNFVKGSPPLDDPIWSWQLSSILTPYIKAASDWWEGIEFLEVKDTGVYKIPVGPKGLMYRFTRSKNQSPIKGIQAFPFVPVPYLGLQQIKGGVSRLINKLCGDQNDPYVIDDIVCVAKDNLPLTFSRGQIIAFVPITVWEAPDKAGVWVYITHEDMEVLGKLTDVLPDKLVSRLVLKN